MKVILCKGLPGAGKTRWAKQLQASNPGQYKHISKDDLRLMLDDGKWSGSNEKMVLKARDLLILLALDNGKHVLVDDTNLNPIHEKHIRDLVKSRNVEVVIQDFTSVPIETCIANDLKRPNSVGEKVIRKMYRDFLNLPVRTILYNPDLPNAIICDLDGTLSLLNGRNPYDASTCDQDLLNDAVYKVLIKFASSHHILLVSGRKEEFRPQTLSFLTRHDVPYDALWMRPTGDNRNDTIIKEEIYDREIRDKYNVVFIMDDRDRLIQMWRSLGLTVFQVADGQF